MGEFKVLVSRYVCKGQGYGWGMDNEVNWLQYSKMPQGARLILFEAQRYLFVKIQWVINILNV